MHHKQNSIAMLGFLCGIMKKWSKLINDMERVLLEGTPFKGRPVVPNPVVSYSVVSNLSLSQFAPQFESARTKVWVRSHPSHGSILTWFLLSLFIRNTCANAWKDVNCCVKQGSRVERVLGVQRKLCCVSLKHYCLAQGKCYILIGKVYCLYLWPRLTSVSEILFLPLLSPL